MNVQKLIGLLLALLLMTGVQAQRENFVYFQTENQRPFYARLNGEVISSSSAGYLILPKMTAGEYEITIGFPKSSGAEETFTFDISEKNEGYLVKHQSNEFSLLNLQSKAVIRPQKKAVMEETAGVTKEVQTTPAPPADDAFASMLSKATQDPTLVRSEAAQKEVKVDAVATGAPVVQSTLIELRGENQANASAGKKDSAQKNESVEATAGEEAVITDVIIKDKAVTAQTQPSAPEPLKRILYVQGKEGSEMVYVDEATKDTVRVLIPRPEQEVVAEVVKPAVQPVAEPAQEPAYTITPTVVPKEEKRKQSVITLRDTNEKKPSAVIEVIEGGATDSVKIEDAADSVTEAPLAKRGLAPCDNAADDKTYMRIRRKIAAENTTDGMVAAARRFFKSHCFTTEQLRSLSYLFLQDEGRYRFFDAAWGHVVDPENFSGLRDQLHEEYYLNRFDAILR